MDTERINRELLDFLDSSPNAFFAVANMAKKLERAGFVRLSEGDIWTLAPGGDYFVTRNGSALIAFRVPAGEWSGFNIMASHADSPSFKVKTDPEISVEGNFTTLNIEKYGGMLCRTWFDRPLSVAGRVVIRTESGVESRLVCVDRDLLMIPSLAIHMDREANSPSAVNVQTEMLPLFAGKCDKGAFLELIAEEADVSPDDILDSDLYLYNRDAGKIFGLNGEFIASGRLDDLQCAFASLTGLLESEPTGSVAVHCVYDNEEVGSGTKQGAASTFLADTLRRICSSFGGDGEDFLRAAANSFMVSADNAHSVHPNYQGKADPTNRPYINGGIVIKYSANQKYTTDAVSGAIFREICKRAGVPTQTFANRSDMIGGSTLGNISTSQVAVNCVDIGLPQLAMHSAYETAGAKDTAFLAAAARELFSCGIRRTGENLFVIE